MSARATITETRGGGMVSIIITAEHRHVAEQARDAYLASWHPMGYGTSLNEAYFHDGLWRISGSRMSSCD
jgi:hypothetical protein